MNNVQNITMETDGHSDRHNKSYRQFRIRNYRNIGVDGEERLVVNRSSRKGELGDLVIIVGPNNSGKSNIMDALKAYPKKAFRDGDVPEWPVGETRIPCVEFELGVSGSDVPEEDVEGAGCVGTIQGYASRTDGVLADSIKSVLRSNMGSLTYVEGGLLADAQALSEIGRKLSNSARTDAERIVRDLCLELTSKHPEANGFVFSMDGRIRALGDKVASSGASNPTVYSYESNIEYGQRDLRCDPLSPNGFCLNLLRSIGMTQVEVANYYDAYRKMGTMGTLRKIEEIINGRLSAVSERFNSMYFIDGAGYDFRVYLTPDTMELNISKGNKILKLDNQSTGFKWFFNFFFGLLEGYTLNEGDMILMDEPATGLHVSGQVELRRFLKEFAVRNQVTFVVSTHSPFLIDCDHLDEVRVVTRDGNGLAHIENNFLTVDSDDSSRDSDKMDSILGALTVGRHILLPPESRVVFVEGITDYNYLTAFKHMFGVEGITFLPIGGVKKDHLAAKLRRIAADPILIVDSDRAGYIAKEKDGSGRRAVDVIALSDIDPSFVNEINAENYRSCGEDARGFTIEDLFSREDLENLIGGTKESNQSSVIKTYIEMYGPLFSEETKANFRKVFDYLEQEFLE